MSDGFAIHWFRRDLRIAGNPALRKAWKNYNGNVVGWFNFDRKFLNRSDFSNNRFHFFLKTLEALQKELQSLGSDLIFTDGDPCESFIQLVKDCDAKGSEKKLAAVSWNRDYEPFARERDKKMSALFLQKNLTSIEDRDHLLIEPHELFRDEQNRSTYQVYSPFARKWMQIFETKCRDRIDEQEKGLGYLNSLNEKKTIQNQFCLTWSTLLNSEKLSAYRSNYKYWHDENFRKTTIHSFPAAGSLAAYNCMVDFSAYVSQYGEQRDFPGTKGTSQSSIYLKNGSLTVAQWIAFLKLAPYKKSKNSYDKFFSELIWREFYYHILYHNPEVETRSFHPKFDALPWENDQKLFEAWKNGLTGYPIVDAGMRQLKTTGWMHNRVRMIVASFLTKDLLIDWRWGENHFMKELLDGDLAPNNGGWQWAASTGCDPQPYFRIFNPELQSMKFDTKGSYIKTFVEELKACPDDEIHNPSQSTRQKLNYPPQIVEHHVQKEKALQLFTSIRDQLTSSQE